MQSWGTVATYGNSNHDKVGIACSRPKILKLTSPWKIVRINNSGTQPECCVFSRLERQGRSILSFDVIALLRLFTARERDHA